MKRILVTEDEMIVALDLERRLKKLGYDVCKVVSSGEDAIREAALLRPCLVLMDICLAGEIDGVEAAGRIRAEQDIPIIYLTANADDKTLQRAEATHPTSYLLKPFRERELQICIEMSLTNHRLQQELRQARDRLEERVQERTAELAATNLSLRREIEARAEAEKLIREQAALLDKARDAIYAQQLDGTVIYWNRSAERLYGVPSSHAIGEPVDKLIGAMHVAGNLSPFEETTHSGEWIGEIVRTTAAGARLAVESRWTLVRDERDQPVSILVVETDITERKSIEAQFFHAQRLESVGALASGIAHDLNNVFTPLLMSAQALEDAPPGSYNAHLAEIIFNSSRRGAEMVRQILLFVRGAEGERVPLQLDHLVKEVQKLLRETLPRSIRIQTRTAPELRSVKADATQLHQVLMNLCVNARDAMPNGGELSLELSNVPEGSHEFRNLPGAAGDYVRISVSDTGTGIPPEIQSRIFAPFFTTKETGKGTGLGLSTVQAIVKNHHGFVDLQSTVGAGTKFLIYLPACEEEDLDSALTEGDCPSGHGELILVADDEACVREIVKATLEAFDYRVLLAEDGVDALSQFAQRRTEIACVISDNSMPFLDGVGCLRALRRINVQAPVVLMSGSGTATIPSALAQEPNVKFLSKPFTQAQLLSAIYGCLHPEELARPVN